MGKRYYLGVVEKDADSAWGMWFPDMPGCFPAADKLDDLPRAAAEILRQHVEALESNGRVVPTPCSIDDVVRDESIMRGAITILVPS